MIKSFVYIKYMYIFAVQNMTLIHCLKIRINENNCRVGVCYGLFFFLYQTNKIKYMANLQLSLTKKWFDLTKSRVKTEDYRDITEYWVKRLISDSFAFDCISLSGNFKMNRAELHFRSCPNGFFKKFDSNIMTLGYPKSTDSERILKFEHKGIEIREGNPEWGAEPNKLYFVILHGSFLK